MTNVEFYDEIFILWTLLNSFATKNYYFIIYLLPYDFASVLPK